MLVAGEKAGTNTIASQRSDESRYKIIIKILVW